MEVKFLKALKPYLAKFDITYKALSMLTKPNSLLGRSLVLDWIKENLPGMRIESRPLQSIIHKFDLFIIDYPSTGLIEAAATFAEILLYAGNPYHTPSKNDIGILTKRAIVGFTEEDFVEKIRTVLDGGKIISNVNDTALLEKYGTYLNDGNSLERVTGNIREIIKD
jgi:hypothetical protein